MALNVYLIFYKGYSAKDLKDMEKWYFLLCYGLPLPLAVALLLIETEERGKIYGPALVRISRNWRRYLFEGKENTDYIYSSAPIRFGVPFLNHGSFFA
jgi:hypothetical protein